MKRVNAGLLSVLLAVLMIAEAACGQAPPAPSQAPAKAAAPAPVKKKVFDLSEAIGELRSKLPFDARGRRDPFKSPLLVVGLPIEVMAEADQKRIVEEAEKIMASIRAMLARGDLGAAVREGVALLKWVNEALRKKVLSIAEYRERAEKVRAELQQLLVKMKNEVIEIWRQEAQKALAEFRKSFDEGDYRAVIDGVGSFREGMKEVAAESPEVQAALDEALKLAERARIHLEFENIEIVISGLIWTPTGALAIINGTDVQATPPDNVVTVEAAPVPLMLEVKSIGREEVVFVYKGEQVVRALYE